MADFAYNGLGMRKVAVLHLNTDWGTTAKNLFVEAFKELGGEVLAIEGYLPDEKDFRATLTRIKATGPDGIVMESYYPDAALITRQIRDAGLDVTLLGVSSIYSPDFIKLAGDAAEGVYTTANFAPNLPRQEVKDFVTAFEARYGTMPNSFNAMAYDTMNILAEVMRQYGTSREDIKAGLAKISGISSVIFPEVKFDLETRRVSGPKFAKLVIKDGTFEIYDAAD